MYMNLTVAMYVILPAQRQKRCRKRNREVWVRKWIMDRIKYRAYHQLIRELSLDISSYYNFVRMSATTFEEPLQMVAPLITRQDTNMCAAIPAGEISSHTMIYCNW